mmetsp:Transcript_19280/g.56567  ORF Transcript_19280/g.56567 Transcript_19280/m.56567 type:complete len:221 (-) Transcript_19280:97-759(-)
MASTAHTTSTTCPNHVQLVLSRAAYRAVPCSVPHVATRHAPLLTSPHRLPVTSAVCACPPCIALQWGDSEMVAVFGKVKKSRRRRVPQARRPRAAANEVAGGVGRVTQGEAAGRRSARTVARGALLALAVLKGKAHTLAEDTVVNTDTVPAGYLVVKAQWLRLEQRECEGKCFGLRSYTLLAAETLIIVNHMVRLAGLRFLPGPGGPADPASWGAREKLY